jgi:hypothetical protein
MPDNLEWKEWSQYVLKNIDNAIKDVRSVRDSTISQAAQQDQIIKVIEGLADKIKHMEQVEGELKDSITEHKTEVNAEISKMRIDIEKRMGNAPDESGKKSKKISKETAGIGGVIALALYELYKLISNGGTP